MLCERCRLIQFRACESLNTNPDFANKLVCVLHETRQSFLTSILGGCHFCCLVRAQVPGRTEIKSVACDELGADVILAIYHQSLASTRARGVQVLILSRYGNAKLEEIETQIPEVYSSVLENQRRSARQYLLGHQNSAAIQPSGSNPLVNIDLVALWRDECLRNHSLCRRGSPVTAGTHRPTRLLNVSDLNNPFLEETNDSTQGSYVALSYKWGDGRKALLTLKENVETHQWGISLGDLPLTCRDAIFVTNWLGYKYIWIDALCIIQNDGGDLDHELKHMHYIYRHAVLTICAEGAADSHAGFFHNKNPLELHPCQIRLTDASESPNIIRDVVLKGTCSGDNYISQRGWVLQEEVLTSRALRFGAQMKWNCMESHAQETDPIPKPKWRLSPRDDSRYENTHLLDSVETMRLWLYAPERACNISQPFYGRPTPKANSQRFVVWRDLVEQYSKRQLTSAKDTLRAVSALSNMFAEVHGDTYLAGLWKENLVPELAWFVETNDRRDTTTPEMRLAAPTWSWASVGKVNVHFARSPLGWENKSIRTVDPVIIKDAFCTLGDPIHGSRASKGQVWTLRLFGNMKKFLLRQDPKYTDWRINVMTYGGRIRNPENYGATFAEENTARQAANPRFPALLCDARDASRVVGEAALDLQALPFAGDGNREIPREMEVFCLPLRDGNLLNEVREVFTCLVLVPRSPGSSSFSRIALGFVNRDRWFDGDDDGDEKVDCEIV
ncbi:heterokaryon incompatibility protein-domain-containing protein [Lasiosphaeria hispida]|uniref:Heterokaryon incompatibility protein-domain-containing protein n=1 Tax=Lasiosphaeria hispida TaxID=260671 RepID=A0AAJ0HED7_9PEZI|nr:heterokaryon incompatibility protein-domain-containing protein [Lasiosphaeria hispida]